MTGYEIAKTKLGLHEVKNTIELNLFISSNLPIWKGLSVDTTPWCAAFVNACEHVAGHKGTGRLDARSFLNYGTAVYMDRDMVDVMLGDIVIFTRGGSTWQGHVAYFDGLEESKNGLLVRTVGGNQSDSVSKGWYPVNRLLGVRRP